MFTPFLQNRISRHPGIVTHARPHRNKCQSRTSGSCTCFSAPDFILSLRRLPTGCVKTMLLRPPSSKALHDPAKPLSLTSCYSLDRALHSQVLNCLHCACTPCWLTHACLCAGGSLCLTLSCPQWATFWTIFYTSQLRGHKEQFLPTSQQHEPELGVPLVLPPLKFPLQIPPHIADHPGVGLGLTGLRICRPHRVRGHSRWPIRIHSAPSTAPGPTPGRPWPGHSQSPQCPATSSPSPLSTENLCHSFRNQLALFHLVTAPAR